MWGEAKRDLASVVFKNLKEEVVASLPSYRKRESLDLLALHCFWVVVRKHHDKREAPGGEKGGGKGIEETLSPSPFQVSRAFDCMSERRLQVETHKEGEVYALSSHHMSLSIMTAGAARPRFRTYCRSTANKEEEEKC